jgi:hypothetical protein
MAPLWRIPSRLSFRAERPGFFLRTFFVRRGAQRGICFFLAKKNRGVIFITPRNFFAFRFSIFAFRFFCSRLSRERA